jgi:antitoxin component of MazEF toxin-antitoxin module
MKVRVQKRGDTLVLPIPKSLAVKSNIKEGSTVELSLSQARIAIEYCLESGYTLEELLAGIKKCDLHKETDFGKPLRK